MAKRKSTKGQTMIYKTYTKSKRSSNRNPTKTGGEHRCSGRVCSAFQSIRKAIPLSFRRYFQVHISVFLLIRAYISILELAVLNVIDLII
jgi:hypothetical protein